MLQHGKHVLCEKPACSNLAELETILDAAAKSGCAFLEAMYVWNMESVLLLLYFSFFFFFGGGGDDES